MQKRGFVCFIIIFIFSNITSAQKIKFKDAFEYVKSKDYDGAQNYLKLVLKTDSLHAAANLYLGSINYYKAKNTDVLKQYAALAQFCDSASFYLSRAKRLINDKEIKKNDDHYSIYAKSKKDTNKLINDKDTLLARVTSDIVLKINDLKKHKTSCSKIFNAFSKGVSFYNASAMKFRDLSDKYVTEKEMLLLSNDETYKNLKNIALNFDSASYYLAEYSKAIKDYPLKEYKQNFVPVNIETFRLDGLQMPDFLAPQVRLWNYTQWAKTNMEIIDKDIKKMRAQLVAYENTYNNYFNAIQNRTINEDSAKAFLPDKKILMMANKYDFGALPVKLLNYKAKKLSFLVTSLDKYNHTDSLNPYTIEPRAMLFTDLNQKIKLCDTALMDINKMNIETEAKKYPYHISKIYTNTETLKTYLVNEQQFVSFFKNHYAENYIKMLYLYLQKWNDSTAYVVYNNTEVPLCPTLNASKPGYKVTAIREDKFGNIYLCGYNGNNANATSFVCKINPYRQVIWLKTIPVKLENKAGLSTEFPSAIEVVGDGCVVGLNYKVGNSLKNYLVKYDKVGNEIYSKAFDLGKTVRKIIYDEVGDNFMMALKGTTLNEYVDAEEQVTIANVNNQGGAVWLQQLFLTGNVADFIKIFEGYLLVCNFTKVGAGASSQIVSRAGNALTQTNIFLMKISGQGKIVAYETIPSYTPVYAIGAVKVSSSNINIVGYNHDFLPDFRFTKFAQKEKQIQKVINSNVEFVY